jgi:endogenous inhibitor of DNA gyrase (YacG/DUF329 family)
MIDLGNWLSEQYRIPVSSLEEPLPGDSEEHTLS